MRSAIATPLVALILAACGAGSGGGQSPPQGLVPTLASIQANVFTPICAKSGCHGGAMAQQGLQLDAGFSYGNLINVASPQDPSLTRVIPFDPDNSLIIQKLEGRRFDNAPILGERMPDKGPYLQQSTIDVIRLWIANGAQQ